MTHVTKTDRSGNIVQLMDGTLRVGDVMSTDLFTIFDDDNIQLAEDMMSWRRIRHVPVINQVGKLVGLITHRDLLKASISSLASIDRHNRRDIQSHVAATSIMTKHPKSVTPTFPLREAADLMAKNKYGCLLVVNGDELVGILTEADFVKLISGLA